MLPFGLLTNGGLKGKTADYHDKVAFSQSKQLASIE
jgi:hypothetical protein